MSTSKSVQRRDTPPIEGEIRDFVRQEAPRQEAKEDSDGAANGVGNVIKRIAGTSITEIDRLIAELTQVRDHLQNEGKRVEAEIAAFGQIGGVAVNSIREISQSLSRFKRAAQQNND
jgi:hypothetical protein